MGLAALASAAALAAPRAIAPLETTTFRLDNGLEFVVHEDHSTPLVAVVVYYDIGSSGDPPGRSGFAHLFEHLAFQETEHLQRGDLDRLIVGGGGFYNGATLDDYTLYVEVLPSNRLNLALWIEAERMARLKVTDENFAREREVVKEEHRMRRANQPYGESGEKLRTLATDYTPYSRASSMMDLDVATTADVRDFYERYYGPNRATVIVAGHVTESAVRELAARYFAAIPRGPDLPALPPPSPTPRSSGERRAILNDPLATLPRIDIAFNIPPRRHEDTNALWLLATLLGEGESSRLHQRLVAGERATPRATSSFDSKYGPGLLVLRASPAPDVPPERLERLIEAEINKVQAGEVTARELEKAKNQLLANLLINRRQAVFWKALMLQDAHLMYGDVNAVNTSLDDLLAVDVDDITRVARTYLVPANRTVVTTLPAEPAPAKEP